MRELHAEFALDFETNPAAMFIESKAEIERLMAAAGTANATVR